MLFNKLSNCLQSSIRLVLTVIVCGLLFISVANPVQAATSKVTDGEVTLSEIQAKTDDVASKNPRDIDEVTEEAQKGLNAVQGSANSKEMVSPDEADGTTVKEKAINFFDQLTD